MKLAVVLLLSVLALGCKEPPEGGVVGDKTYFNFYVSENSGMAYSTATEKIYIIEDSGNPSKVWVINKQGEKLDRVDLPYPNVDYEAAAYYDGRVYVGDIGDNTDDRGEYWIYSFRESDYSDFQKRKYTYEDGDTNGEGLAIDPTNGDIYITSKKYGYDTHTLYKLEGNVAKKVFNFQSKSVGALSMTTDGKLFVTIEDDYDYIRFFDKTGKEVKKIIPGDEGSKESLEVIGPNQLIYSAEGLDYFRTVTF